ncbi:helix-turn-helix domain-containing protein [Nonomuraea sp. NPDC050383]|uniref:helix-turn-helix domain-containing protein n=1 Tax=Nonomuraea sp. NPDC050383 TaxID=3364362 RepID=UPI0037B274E3
MTRTQAAAEQFTLLFTIPEAAKQLRLGPVTVYALITDGDLEAIDVARPGSTRTHLRVPLSAIQKYIATRPRVHKPTP